MTMRCLCERRPKNRDRVGMNTINLPFAAFFRAYRLLQHFSLNEYRMFCPDLEVGSRDMLAILKVQVAVTVYLQQ
ncbi:hypothetical protein NTE_00320 [Candidatus Nitrososphaera evergladensis SR1]|uniref:Uncharacterized protein n=1 Tax=Candidatus Nitrososphaera evergladensis SR1 TaxID=1459636 RepID=A0A075MNL4_9ARCH|nr:hypothetical protein NTE_00320 [Candidatus Nitrososphaera evergladensis SR1]